MKVPNPYTEEYCRMPLTQRDRDRKRRQRRQKKMKELKLRLEQAKDPKEKEIIIEKIRQVSPWIEIN